MLACLVGAIVLLTGLAASHGYRPRAEASQNEKRQGKGDATKDRGGLTPQASRAEEQAIRKVNESYSAAYNKGDLDGMLADWAEDAEFISESGKVYRGKPQLRVLLKKSLAHNKGAKQSNTTQSIRFLKPDVAVELGTVTVTSPDGATDSGPFETMWVKTNGRWYITRVRDLPDMHEDDRPVAYHKLKPLAWMVGEWVDREGKGDVKLSCRWAPGQTFLIQEFTVRQGNDKTLTVTQRIGWDPTTEQLRSWVYDSTGGFGQGLWTRTGNTWNVESTGVFPDGRHSTAHNHWKYGDDTTMTFSSTNRQADEQPLPDVTVTFVKKKDR
jgi:uncharacterized protein (TIGR02246 family)